VLVERRRVGMGACFRLAELGARTRADNGHYSIY
jgi:hypothetical protein